MASLTVELRPTIGKVVWTPARWPVTMIVLLYLPLALGLYALARDLTGRLTVEPDRVRVWHAVGLVAGIGASLAPALALALGTLGETGPAFTWIAVAYALAAALFAFGILAEGGTEAAAPARRAGYGMLLLLAAIPSWSLLFLAPLVGLAAVGLAKPQLGPEGKGG